MSATDQPAGPPGNPLILNLGCGTKTSPAAVNIDWSFYLRLHRSRVGRALAPFLLRGYRLESFRAISGEVLLHDLRKGIPFDSGTVDAVYHSHILEHIDRDAVPGFFAEIRRVLKPGGIHRIAVPNFGRDARDYVDSLERELPNHDDMLVPLLTLSVQREAPGTSTQPPLRRRLENLLLGDARKRGLTHQWGYDHVNLRQLLEANGFVDFELSDFNQSAIPGWAGMGLEVEADGSAYKPGSMWAEARKPA
jgi:SAM-dependent methyltransferase